MLEPQEIERAIRQALAPEHVEVVDTTGTRDHFEAVVVASAFDGRSRVQQHQLVYQALGDHMRQRIHALALRTLTPAQWRSSPAGARAAGGSHVGEG
jgi:stress-induced morphogen